MFESELVIDTATCDAQKAEFVLTPEIGVDLTPSTRLTVIGLCSNRTSAMHPKADLYDLYCTT